MSNETTDYNTESRPEWDHLEDWLRGQVQGMVQYMLEEEVTEFLGRLKSARRSDADNDSGYRNGYAPCPEAYVVIGDDSGEEAEGAGHRGAVREQAAAAVRQQGPPGSRS